MLYPKTYLSKWTTKLHVVFIVISMVLVYACSDTSVNLNTASTASQDPSSQQDLFLTPHTNPQVQSDMNMMTHNIDMFMNQITDPMSNFRAAPATLHRLSRMQIRQSIRDLFQVSFESPLEVDSILHGFVSVAASELTISPLFAEQIEKVSWEVAAQVISNINLLNPLVACSTLQLEQLDLTQTTERNSVLNQLRSLLTQEQCLRVSLAVLIRKVWRGHYDVFELQHIQNLVSQVTQQLQDPLEGFKAAIAYMLQSPYFLFRIEQGEVDSDVSDHHLSNRRYTSIEMAARLSYFLWGSTPDDILLTKGLEGELLTDEAIQTESIRLLQSDKARKHLSQFFDEFIGLQNLALVLKDESLFPEVNPELKQAMREEVLWLFTHIVFDENTDFRKILTSEESYLNKDLANLYNVNYQEDQWQRFTLPPEQERGGLLGRAGVLSLFSHATVNSPTFRGRFVRAQLLCQDVPPPPEGVVTELPNNEEVQNQTLRQRLSMHANDPLCASCHNLMDPLGFPLEHFDPIGRWRILDNTQPIDASGELDGVVVNGARSLAQAVAQHPSFSSCVTRRLYRYATGHLETDGEVIVLDTLDEYFVAQADYNLQSLILALVLSDGFRKADVPRGMLCDEEDTRACQTDCGQGVERCHNGHWSECSAPFPQTESCDGQDQDCDGHIDEGVIQVCDHQCGTLGVQSCMMGAWQTCEVSHRTPEVCDGQDQDCDGQIDEDVAQVIEICDGQDQDCDGQIDEEIMSYQADGTVTELATLHEGCTQWGNKDHCNSAVHRFCGQQGCAQTGFGTFNQNADEISWVCLTADQAHIHHTSYQELSQKHPVCDQTREVIGPNCNAAIHRFCGDLGQTTGFGPIEYQGNQAFIVCVPQANVITTSYSILSQHHAGCTQNGERIGPHCDQAIHQFCVAQGAMSGWGPLENSGDVAIVSCFFTP